MACAAVSQTGLIPHGEHIVSKALPYLLERVADERLPETALTPLEQAARAWRKEAELDLGGRASRD